MSKQLRTRTDYDFERMEELQRVAGRTFGRKETMRKRAFSLAGGVFFVVAGMLMAYRDNQVFFPLLLCLLGTLLLVWGTFFYAISAWTASKAMGKNWKGNDFVFEKDGVLAINGEESFRYPYTACLDLLETELTLYFILDSGQGLLLDKANVKGGSVDDLRAWLEEKCGKKTRWVGKKQKTQAPDGK